MSKTTKYAWKQGVWVKTVIHLLVCVFSLFRFQFLMAQDIHFPKNEEQYYSLPNDWSPITNVSDKMQVLQLLVSTSNNNKDRLKTLQALFSVQYEGGISNAIAKEIFSNLDRLDDKTITHKVDFTLQLASDFSRGKTYRRREEITGIFQNGGKRINLDNTKAYDITSIVTQNDHVYSHNNEILPTIPELPNFLGTENKRVAWREPPESIAGRTLVEMIDPREYFDLKTWGNVERFWECMKGKHGEPLKAASLKDILLFEAKDEKNMLWYRVFYRVEGGSDYDEVNIFWNQEMDFYPICYLYTNASHSTVNLLQVRWKRVDDVFLPFESNVVSYYDTGKLSYRRKITLGDVVINKPIPSPQFSYSALGLGDGDILVDRVKQQVFTIQNDKPVYLAKFYEKYQTPHERSINRVRMFMIILGFTLIVLGLYLKIRRKRSEKTPK